MFFRRKQKPDADPPAYAPHPRVDDVRVTAIEPLQFDVRQTLDVSDHEIDFRKDRGALAPATLETQEREDDGTQTFRPRLRPPMAVLKVFDDNQKTADMIRIRGNRLTIGRDEGDVVIAHDKLMSKCHAELVRRFVDDAYVWHLHDLKSRNGTFVKVDFMRLRAGDELILGSATYLFEDSRQSPPRLLELGSRQPRQVKFEQAEFWIGQDRKQCSVTLANDPLLDDKHVRIHFTKERWCVEAASSQNGVWARIDQVQVGNGTRFQLGEQRFQILLP